MDETYVYETVDTSCAQCEGMVGCYDYPVDRPHDYCDCDVSPAATNIKANCQMTEWEITDRTWCAGAQGEYMCKATVKVTVRCVNPETMQPISGPHSDEFEFTQSEEEAKDGVSQVALFAREKAHDVCSGNCDLYW